jgi:pimeloyl-ACP methyl ester carboxylesterase
MIYQSDQPGKIEPDPEWEETVNRPDLTREKFFVQSGDIHLEVEIITPAGGNLVKPAILFVPGSGNTIYQSYAPGLLEKYVQNIFFPRDFAVVYVNKRGLGESGGNWMKNDFQGRADDVYAVVKHLQTFSSIDSQQIGLIGHSQGGWVVNLVAAQHSDVAFFISLVGPTTSVIEQMEDIYENDFRCQGYMADDLQRKLDRQLRLSRFGAAVGKFIHVGIIGFDSGIINYDPEDILLNTKTPGLFAFGENDPYVPGDQNIRRFNEVFPNGSEHLTATIIAEGNHHFRMTDSVCTSYEEGLQAPFSEQLVEIIEKWLSELGY